MFSSKDKSNWLKRGQGCRGGEERRVYACGRQGGVAGKLVADVKSLAIETQSGNVSLQQKKKYC
jgi:hypothetical protein